MSIVNSIISIHALREEGDRRCGDSVGLDQVFLSTPSARRATISGFGFSMVLDEFLSTPSARRATFPIVSAPSPGAYFYPRPPRGGRRFLIELQPQTGHISIHALREEGDATAPM